MPQQPVPPPAAPSPSPPAAALHMCSFYYGQLRAATADVDKLRAMNWDLSRQMLSLREELMLERSKVQQLQQAAKAGAKLKL